LLDVNLGDGDITPVLEALHARKFRCWSIREARFPRPSPVVIPN
jgi:hypothetical protein